MIRPPTPTLTLTLTFAFTFTFTFTSPAHAEEPPPPPPPAPPSVRAPAPTASLAETVVRAAPEPVATPREDQAAAASVVLPDDSPRAYDDLAALLAQVPGVNTVRTGSLLKSTTISLRGSNPDQVRIFVDGVPLNIAAGGGVDISTLPIGDVERVEVYRGSSPLAFGQSAMGGIISITTRTPGDARARARTGTGSFGTMFGDVSGGGRAGRLRLYVGLHAVSAQGDFPYLNDNMTAFNTSDDVMMPRQNNDVQQGDGVLRAALTLSGRRTLNLGVIAFARDEGLQGPGGSPSTRARFRTLRGVAYLRYESRDDLGPGGRLSAQLFASLQRDRLDDATDETGLGGPVLTRNTIDAVGVNTHAARPFGDWARGAAVLEARFERFRPVNELAAVPVGVPARRVAGVAGAEIDLRWRRLDLDFIPSARVEAMQDLVSRRDTVGVPIENVPAVSRWSPVLRAALVRPVIDAPTLKAVAKANVGRYVRVPSFFELYGDGTPYLLGNDGLVPERGMNADLAFWLDRQGERISLGSRTTFFGARVDDLIQWEYAPWGQARASNIARARIAGIEQELRVSFGRWGRLVGQATYLDARDASNDTSSNGKQLPFHARYRGYLRPELVRLALPGGTELGAFADADVRMGAYSDPANLQDMRTRLLLGGGVSVTWPRARLRATASAANLTATRLEDVSGWSLPGRSVFFALAYAPIGGDGGTGSAVFNPRYGQ